MKQQNFMKLKNLIILAGAILLFGACTDTYSPVEIPTAPETPKRIIEQSIDKKHQCLWNCHPFGYS